MTDVSTQPARTAIVYDFDGTLAPGNIQEHSLLPERLGVTKEAFWEMVASGKQSHDADQILVYMLLLMKRARELGKPLTRAVLREHGGTVPFFEGVETWFERLNTYARERNLALEHYVVSSANEEMIEGCRIARHFTRIFGCTYIYDEHGNAEWPGSAVNYTTKTQFLFRINKGVENHWEDDQVNRWVPMAERPIPFERMLYIGDGDTDIPSMKMVRHQGGHSVAVFDPQRWAEGTAQNRAYNLIAEDRAHFVVPADYRENSQLDVTVKGILGRIARNEGWRE
jgi:phosphoserine phosphatase